MTKQKAFTIVEILVSMALAGIVLSIIALTIRNLNAMNRVQAEVSYATETQKILRNRLTSLILETDETGIHISSDAQTVSIQPLDRISSGGSQQWSPQASLLNYSLSEKQLTLKKVALGSAGLSVSSENATSIADGDFPGLLAAAPQDERFFKDVAECEFQLDKTRNSLSLIATIQVKRKAFRFAEGFHFQENHE